MHKNLDYCGDNIPGGYVITENRAYFNYDPSFDGTSGCGCGTLANRPTICTVGVGYWATNQSCSDLTGMVGANPSTPVSGTFYKCTAPNAWTAYYTPYTYPHPLRGNSSSVHVPGPANPAATNGAIATIRLHNARLTVMLPLTLHSPELTIVDFAGREIYRAVLSVAPGKMDARGSIVYDCAWRGAFGAGTYIAVVNEPSRVGGAVMARTMFIVE